GRLRAIVACSGPAGGPSRRIAWTRPARSALDARAGQIGCSPRPPDSFELPRNRIPQRRVDDVWRVIMELPILNTTDAPDLLTTLPVAAASPLRSPEPLPMTRAEMEARGWDEVDVVFVTGDAYVDHPSFAMALLGRVLEAAGFRVGIVSQPDWHNCEDWRRFGRPRLFFAISAGNMDSMINH